MSRSGVERVGDIVVAIERCRRYLSMASVRADEKDLLDMAEDAIERNLQVIGEAATHLPAAITGAHPEVPWPQIRGFRNILVHQYFGVDLEVVRDVVEHHLPVLEAALAGYRAEDFAGPLGVV